MKSAIRHARFQAPLATTRSGLSDIWRRAFILSGRFQPFNASAAKVIGCGDVHFRGDIPIRAGDARKQTCLCFSSPPTLIEEVENLTVTPAGAGWKDGVLYEKYSSSKPGLRSLWRRPVPQQTLSEAYFVQSEHTDTFGDWMSEYLAPIALAGKIKAPVLLPASLAAQPYVSRDAARLGVQFLPIEHPIRIEKANVIRQTKFIRYWTAPDTTALRDFLNVEPLEPEPGSVVYLSRRGESSDVAIRSHPNLTLEKTVVERGGVVLRTAEASLDDYLSVSRSAETVIFDHGSAGYNMIYWRPKRVIEIVSDAWWMNAFLFFADAIGVNDYRIIRSDLGDKANVAEKLSNALAAPFAISAAPPTDAPASTTHAKDNDRPAP